MILYDDTVVRYWYFFRKLLVVGGRISVQVGGVLMTLTKANAIY